MGIRRRQVLWLSHFVPYPPKGGMLLRSYNLLKETAKYHDVYLLCFIQKAPLETMFANVEEGCKEAVMHLTGFCKHVELVQISSERYRYGKYTLAIRSLFSRHSYNINWLRSSAFELAIQNIKRTQAIDLVHFDTISLAPYRAELSSFPKTLTHHNAESHMLIRRAGAEKNWLKKLYFFIEGIKLRRYERQNCKYFDKNITCSELDSTRLLEVDATLDVVEISNGVDIEHFEPTDIPWTPYSLIFVGGMNWYPNSAAMLFFANKVWPKLRQECPEAVIDVIGQDPPRKLLELAENDESFRVHGFVDDILPYLNKAWVYVCPINDGGGTKLKILDALSMAKAIVAHPVSCEGIQVADGVSVSYAETAEEYVDKILFLFRNHATAEEMGIAGRKLICEKYSYASLGRKMAELYGSL